MSKVRLPPFSFRDVGAADYVCRCRRCATKFFGPKRCTICATCNVENKPTPSDADIGFIARLVAVAKSYMATATEPHEIKDFVNTAADQLGVDLKAGEI